jgi:hypothetical protein
MSTSHHESVLSPAASATGFIFHRPRNRNHASLPFLSLIPALTHLLIETLLHVESESRIRACRAIVRSSISRLLSACSICGLAL